MRTGLLALVMVMLLPVWGCARENDASAPEPAEVLTPVATTCNEKWVFMYTVTGSPMAAKALPDASADMEMEAVERYAPASGLELFFYADGTFKIRDWIYGASMGTVQSLYSGTYIKATDPACMELVFDTERPPLAPYFMHVLRDNRTDERATPLTKCNITIIDDTETEDTGENWLKVSIVCHDDKGLPYIMGQAMFTRCDLVEDVDAPGKP